MSYGTIKVDTITFTDNSVDKSVSLSGLIQNPTFTGNITVTGTISGDVIRGGTTVSGATVTGTTANFVSGVFTTQISGATVTGTTASFTSGVFTNISGTTATITSGIIASGTDAAPSLAILADLDTGLFSPGANQLAVATNGVGRLSIDSSGNVGIAAVGGEADYTDYGKALVFGSSAETTLGIVLRTGSTGTSSIAFADNSGSGGGAQDGLIEYSQTTRALNFHTAGDSSPRLVIDSSGRVGVGTSSPSTTLSVAGGISGTAGANISGAGWGVLPYVANSLVIDNNAGEARFFATGANATTRGSFIFYNGETDGGAGAAMVIDSSSRVGIGTSTVSRLLHIAQAKSTAYSSSDFEQDYQILRLNNTTDDGSVGLEFQVGTNGQAAITADEVTDGNTDICFGTRGSGARTEKVRITSAGLVGVGTSSPAVNLQVNAASDVSLALMNSSPVTSGNRGNISCFNSDVNTVGTIRFAAVTDNVGTEIQFFTRPAAGSLTQSMTLDSTGRLGIGTTSPLRDLHVSNGGAEGYEFGPGEASNINQTLHYNRSTSVYIENSNRASAHSWDVQTSEKMRLDTSGRLLVGTPSAPTVGVPASATFVVQGYAGVPTGDSLISLQRGQAPASISSGAQLGAITFGANDGSPYAQIHAATDGAGAANDYPGRLVFSTTADGASSPTERMRITSGGDLLVNTTSSSVTSPGTILAVGGQSFFSVAASTSATNTLHVYSSTASAYRFYVGLGGTINATNTTICP
jgi:hypothetical protein